MDDDDCTVTADVFGKDWLAYTINQDAAGWRWTCSLLGVQFATGTEPTEARAIKMAQAVRSARFAAELAELRANPIDYHPAGRG